MRFLSAGLTLCALAACSEPESRSPAVELSDDAAWTVAAHALTLGKVTGCGELKVLHVAGARIEVECFNGEIRKRHTVTNGAQLQVDGRTVAQ